MRKKYTIVVYYPSFATLGPVVDRKDPEIAGSYPARGRTASQKRENLKGVGLFSNRKKTMYFDQLSMNDWE